MAERTYKKRLEADRGAMTKEDIRKAKNLRTKQRNAGRRAERIAAADDRARRFAALTPQQQHAKLMRGGAKEQARAAKLKRPKVA